VDNETVLYSPRRGNYITAMGFVGRRLLVAGNLDGQHEYGMDLYLLDPEANQVTNLVRTPKFWEEGACVSPKTRSVVFMSNAASPYEIDFNNRDWASQPEERDYWITDSSGKQPERLTFFTDPEAPEYLGGRSMVAVCGFSPDGRYLAGTLGIDRSPGRKRNLVLKIVLIEFKRPL
jgi:Tol biopolymer transport system component